MTIYQTVARLEANGEEGALCTVVHTNGSVPRHPGSKMVVFPDRTFEGTIGGGEVESRVIDEALAAITDGKPRLLHFDMVDPARGDPGVCGGQLEVYIEPVKTQPFLIVIGGGHVGKAVVSLGKWLGFRVALSDDRPEFCTPESAPGADEYYPVAIQNLPSAVKIHRDTYIVLTTRGSGVDVEGLPSLLSTPARYIGIIGSKRRWLVTAKALEEKGISRAALERVHSPIGIEIQAETPEEIAVSILAEVLMIRHGGSGDPMKS